MKHLEKAPNDGEYVMLPELMDERTRKKRQKIMKLN